MGIKLWMFSLRLFELLRVRGFNPSDGVGEFRVIVKTAI